MADSDSSIISLTASLADDAEGSLDGGDSDGDLANRLARVAIDCEPEVIDLISDDDDDLAAPAADDEALHTLW